MAQVLTVLEERWGSGNGYLDHIGVERATRDAIASELLVEQACVAADSMSAPAHPFVTRRLRQQVLLQEIRHIPERLQLVRALRESVSLVLVDVVADLDATLA